MSNAAITWAAGMHPGPGPKSVLFWLADAASDHSGEDWTCFPSITALMDKTDMSRATVERHLSLLWREGYISRTRRRRADGKLGIYDFTLHRAAELRAALKAGRAKTQQPDLTEVSEGSEGGEPYVNLTCGPCVNLEPAIRQNEAQPYVKLRGQEPLVEPLLEPSTASAREPGSEGFDEAVELWPESGRKRTLWAQGRAAWALACSFETPDRLIAAILAASTDPEALKGDHGFAGLHTWLSEERWRAFLKPVVAVEGSRTAFAGPEALRADVVAAKGEGFAFSYLDQCGLSANDALVPRTVEAFKRLGEVSHIIARHGLGLVAPGSSNPGGNS